MKYTLGFLGLVVLAACAGKETKPAVAAASAPVLTFITSTREPQKYTLQELQTLLPEKRLTVKAAPAYKGKTKTFAGFPLIDLLKLADPSLNLAKPFHIGVTTVDRWKAPHYHSKVLLAGNALIAVREVEGTLTQPISEDGLWSIAIDGGKRFHPGPYYLVWNDPGKNPDVMPMQVETISVLLKAK